MAKTAFINAKIYNTAAGRFEDGALVAENGKICSMNPADAEETVDCGGAYMIPGLIDVHTHGRGGYDSTEVNCAEMLDMAKSYAKAGTTSFMPTLMSVPLPTLENSIDTIVAAKKVQDAGVCGANILGVHLEGRYISEKRKGAHDPRYLTAPDADELAGLIERSRAGNSTIKRFHTIVAPELEGGEAFVKRAVSMGATVTIGHSDATCAICRQAMGWGVKSFTHLYNAMSPLTHRAPGCVGAALSSDAYAELICDGCHVVPEVVNLTYRAKGNDKLIVVTDSAPSAGLPVGQYTMGGAPIIVGTDAARLLDGTLTGSIIDMYTGLMNLVKFAGIPLEEALPCATINPARMIGADDEVGSLEVGKNADFILLGEDKTTIRQVYVRGVEA